MEFDIEDIEYLPFESHDEIPVEKRVSLKGKDYIVGMTYNEYSDSYALYIKDLDGNMLHIGKLTYLVDAVNTVLKGLGDIHIIPVDFADMTREIPSHNHVGKENFSKIKLVLV